MDTAQYIEIYQYSNIKNTPNNGVEKLFVLLNTLINFIVPYKQFCIIFFSFIIIFLIYKTIYYFSSKISISVAIMGYVSIFYFQSYNLMRISLASAIMFFCFKYLYNKQYIKYLVGLLLALNIHFSSIIYIFPIFLLLVYKRSILFFYIIVIVAIISTIYFSDLISSLVTYERYLNYFQTNEKSNIGLLVIINHIPVLAMLLYSKRLNLEKELIAIFTVFTFASFIIGLLSYSISIIGRLYIYFTYPFLLFIPYFLYNLKMEKPKIYWIILPFVFIYFIFRFVIYMQQYLFIDGIMPYKTLF